jgi:hypothetical protein
MGSWLAVVVREVRYLPPRLYVKFADLAGAPVPQGKAWVEIPSQAADGSLPLMPLGDVNASPMDLLAALTAMASTVTDLGPATIRGVAVTHYRVSVDLAKAEAHLRPEARAEFHAFASSLGLATLLVDVWVDGQARVRRVAISLPLPRDSGMPAGFRVSEAVDYYDFGVRVQVSAPPAGEVMSASEFSQFSQTSSSGGSAEAPPPPVSGTLSAAQASSAEQAVRAFWAALSRNSAHAVEQTVAPSQRSCVAGFLPGFRFTVKISSLRITAAKPTGTGKATVWFSVDATVEGTGGPAVPVAPPGAAGPTWMRTTEIGGVWYADPGYSGWSVFPPCLSVRHHPGQDRALAGLRAGSMAVLPVPGQPARWAAAPAIRPALAWSIPGPRRGRSWRAIPRFSRVCSTGPGTAGRSLRASRPAPWPAAQAGPAARFFALPGLASATPCAAVNPCGQDAGAGQRIRNSGPGTRARPRRSPYVWSLRHRHRGHLRRRARRPAAVLLLPGGTGSPGIGRAHKMGGYEHCSPKMAREAGAHVIGRVINRSPKPFGRITLDIRVILASFFGPICGDDHPYITRSVGSRSGMLVALRDDRWLRLPREIRYGRLKACALGQRFPRIAGRSVMPEAS